MMWAFRPSTALQDLSHRQLFNVVSRRSFHYTPILAQSPLFNLGGLSTSRESQFLSKELGIPRTEFSPHLELIRSSEVHPFSPHSERPASREAPHRDGSSEVGADPRIVGSLVQELESTKIALNNFRNSEGALCAKIKELEREAFWKWVAIIGFSISILLSTPIGSSDRAKGWYPSFLPRLEWTWPKSNSLSWADPAMEDGSLPPSDSDLLPHGIDDRYSGVPASTSSSSGYFWARQD